MSRVPRSTCVGHFGWPDDTPEYPARSTRLVSALCTRMSWINRITPGADPSNLPASANEPPSAWSKNLVDRTVTLMRRPGREEASAALPEAVSVVRSSAACRDLESELADVSDRNSHPAPWDGCGLNANRPPRKAANLLVRDVPGQSVSDRYEQTQPRVARFAGPTFERRGRVPAVCERPILERRSVTMVLRTRGPGYAWSVKALAVSRLRPGVAVSR